MRVTIASLVVAIGLATWAGCGADNLLDAGTGGSVGTTTSSGTTSSGGGATPLVDGIIGLPCSQDSECEPGARCIAADADEELFGAFVGTPLEGGPANGYCTKTCSDSSECPDDSRCLGDGIHGLCLASCDFGAPTLSTLSDELVSSKCHGRDDLMCTPTQQPGVAVCIPVCGSDAACPADRYCDPAAGVCVDREPTGLPMGASCDPPEPNVPDEAPDCAGLCVGFADANGQTVANTCSAACSLGGDLEGYDCGGLENGLCVFQPVFDEAQAELGDYGLCAGACVSHDACNFMHGQFCTDVGLLEISGRGYCFPAKPCENDDGCELDELCYATLGGMYCLQKNNGDLVFPLDAAAP